MISKLRIENLKSVKKLELECGDVNLFIGTNSSGKSSILQGLLALAQNVEEDAGLNGKLVNLGSFSDNRCFFGEDKRIKVQAIGLSFDLGMDLFWENNSVVLQKTFSTDNEEDEVFSIKARKIQYLSCHRVGPRDIYRKNMSMYETLGNNGQYAIAYLDEHSSDLLEDKLCKGRQDYTLLGQVNWWLSYILNTEISTSEVPNTNFVRAGYTMYGLSDMSPENVGSGISYLVSVLIMCLSAPKQSVLVIENPEIHLHPSAQSRVCEFLYFVSQSGRQLFVETHSDHIFNGFRAGIATGEMDDAKVNIQFTSLDTEHVTKVMKVQFGHMGRVENQTKDLFDQFDLDMNKMIGVR